MLHAILLLAAISSTLATGRVPESPPGHSAPAAAPTPAAPAPAPASAPAVSIAPLKCIVSIAPLAGLIRPLVEAAAPGSTVEILVPPGVSEHAYEPTPAQINALARADLIVLVGLGLDAHIERAVKAQGRGNALIEFATVAGVSAAAPEAQPPDHEHDDFCNHGGTDPHLWLDPRLALKLVCYVHDCMTAYVVNAQSPRNLPPDQRRARIAASREPRIDSRTPSEPERAVHAAFDPLAHSLITLDADYAAALKPHAGKPVVVGHDAWGYLARRYGLEFVPISGLSAGEPTPGALANALDIIRRRGLTSIYVEPQLSPAAARRLASATGTTIRTLDPLGTGDYFAMMRANLAALLAGFEPAPAKP